ncbi:unnamed protein product [Caenorhabditis angaria]|uniref:Uncharacterized protein n=1 Tax=Caenorhabditis angaria TaxID=860376 RepID=A0A9P1I9C5_9PELO|nr:unnamed protein product [Caenorhabditis angaria]
MARALVLSPFSSTFTALQKTLFIAISITAIPMIYTLPPIISLFPSQKSSDIFQNSTDFVPIAHLSATLSSQILLTFSSALFVISLEIFVIIFCAFYVLTRVNQATFSAKTRKIQKQLFIYLLLQTIICFSCGGAQVLIFVGGAILNLNLNPKIGMLSTGLLAWFPVCDSIIMLSFVSIYRKTLWRIWLKVSSDNSNINVLQNSVFTSVK